MTLQTWTCTGPDTQYLVSTLDTHGWERTEKPCEWRHDHIVDENDLRLTAVRDVIERTEYVKFDVKIGRVKGGRKN